jgi:trans-aconitate methyltransferase
VKSLYEQDLAYIQAAAFGELAHGAAPEIIRRLTCAPVQIRRVVDAGCGAGPLTAALVEAGFEVTGIDSSPDLLAIARTAVSKARFIHGSIYETEIPACEAIVALGGP